MTTSILINDLSDQEANAWIEMALVSLTRNLADKIAAELDPSEAKPSLADDIFRELIENPDYISALKDKVDGEDSDGTSDIIDIVTEIGESVAKISGRLVPIAVINIIENFNNNITDIAEFTHEHFKAQADAQKLAKNYAKALKIIAIAERVKEWLDSDLDPTEGLEQYLDVATAAWAAGIIASLAKIAGASSPWAWFFGGLVTLVGQDNIKAFAEYTAAQVEIAANGLVDLGNAFHALASLVGIGLGNLILGLQDIYEGAKQFYQSAGTWIDSVWDAFLGAMATGSPLVLDLDGDGIELVSLANTSVYWNIDGDNFSEASGWVAANDGLLVIDLNGDGAITEHTELFGSLTQDGFTALSAYDTNADGIIDANDTQFGDLQVWQDVNQNGVSEATELYSLKELKGISKNILKANLSKPGND